MSLPFNIFIYFTSDLPEILCLHIKRFGHSEYFGSSKITRDVVFPPTLDFTPYLYKRTTSIANVTQAASAKMIIAARSSDAQFSQPPPPALYNLSGFVSHSGGSSGGHYIAFSRHHVNRKWYCFNDHKVSECTEEKVKLLFIYFIFIYPFIYYHFYLCSILTLGTEAGGLRIILYSKSCTFCS